MKTVFVLILFLVSCSNSSENLEKNIIFGSWNKYQKNDSSNPNLPTLEHVLTFSPDKKLSSLFYQNNVRNDNVEIPYRSGLCIPQSENEFNYSIKGDTIYFHTLTNNPFSMNKYSFFSYEISNDTLIIENEAKFIK